jgi:hypothetical protein
MGSLVWSDLDNDGFRDSGEPGMSDVTLGAYMTNAAGLVYCGTTRARRTAPIFPRHGGWHQWVIRIQRPNSRRKRAVGMPLSGGARECR